MKSNVVKLIIVGDGGVKEVITLQLQGRSTRLKAARGDKFILADGENGLAPENITVHRHGKSLSVSLEGTPDGEPELIIDDYYSDDGDTGKTLVGMAEDGNYHAYIPSDAQFEHSIAMLSDNNMAGNGPSTSVTVIVDTTPPTAVKGLQAIDDVGSVTGAIAEGGVTDDKRPTFQGVAEPGGRRHQQRQHHRHAEQRPEHPGVGCGFRVHDA